MFMTMRAIVQHDGIMSLMCELVQVVFVGRVMQL